MNRSDPWYQAADQVLEMTAADDDDGKRPCARPYCEKRFTPKRDEQKFCSRRCSFKQLSYGRTHGLWEGIVEERGYRVKR